MASSVLARDIAAYSDAELDRYLEEHRGENGWVDVDVKDPENLPESLYYPATQVMSGLLLAEISYFSFNHCVEIEQGARVMPSNPAPSIPTNSPLDYCKFPPTTRHRDFRLGNPPARLRPHQVPLRKRSRLRVTMNLSKTAAGPYTPSILSKRSPRTQKHTATCCGLGMTRFQEWICRGTIVDGEFFWRQFESWRSFRAWQKFHRKDFSGGHDASFYAGRSAYKGFVRAYELWDGGLPEYVKAVKKLLAQHGFARPFQFHEDPMQQDKLTTWIEYFGYECWVSETYTRFLQRKQPSYDEAWKKLVDSNVLRPFETEEYIWDIESSFQRQHEEGQAQKAVELARSAAKAVLISAHKDVSNPRSSRFTSQARAQMMLAAKSRLDAAKESLESIKRRNDLVTEFRRATGKYRTTKKNAEWRRLRLRWILEQVPLIEAELNESNATETCSNTSCGTKRKLGCYNDKSMQDRSRKKRKRSSGVFGKNSRDDPVDDTPPSKRLKNGGKGFGPHETSNGTGAELADDLQGATQIGEEARKRNGHRHTGAKMQGSDQKANGPSNSRLLRQKSTRNAPQPSTDSQPLRRSARIAARQKVLKTVPTRSGIAKSSTRRSRRRMGGTGRAGGRD